MEHIISLENVSKIFQASDGVQVHALDDINLQIKRGEFVTFIGPSGCGKSTLLRIIANLIVQTSGSVSVNDKPPEKARKDRDYGFVFQSATLYDWRTVQKNVELPLEIMGYSRDDRRQRAHEMLDMVELRGFEEKYPWQLSGGMQQRVSIARALAFEPLIMLMDEPFGALDEMTRERMNNELLRIWGTRPEMTVVFVTHSIPEAVYLSNRVVVLSPRPGRIAEVIDIDLPMPRTNDLIDSEEFFHYTNKLRTALREKAGA